MSRVSANILIALDEAAVARELEVALRARSFRAVVAADEASVCSSPTPDVFIAGLDLTGRATLDIVEEWCRRGRPPAALILLGSPSIETRLRARRLTSTWFLESPQTVEDVLDAVGDALPGPRPDGTDATGAIDDSRDVFRCSAPATVDHIDDLVRDMCAFLVRCGVAPSVRARICGAAAEALDNAQRYAYEDVPGRVDVEAEFGGRDLALSVVDSGRGFDPVEAGSVALRDPHKSGLARAAALCEDIRVETSPNRGTRVEFTFQAFPATFDEEDAVDLSELDYLPPALARRVLESLRSVEDEPEYTFSPALAVAVGRMLAGTTAWRSVHTSLWS